MITKFNKFFEKAASLETPDDILLIVDVQSEFSKFIPKRFVAKLNKYAKGFSHVYQIWDSNKTNKPTYKFPNEQELVEKKYGVKKYYKNLDGGFDEWLSTIFDDNIAQTIKDLIKQKKLKVGDKYKLKDKDEFLVYVGNAHQWFLVNNGLYLLFKKLVNRNVIIVGGADNECLEDVYVSAKSFGLKPVYNHEYIYSVETNNNQISQVS